MTTTKGYETLNRLTNITTINSQPSTLNSFSYADNSAKDGNLTNDGRWTLTWDAENRLTAMTSLTTAPSGSKRKLEFVYDHQSRRIQKTVSAWNGSSYVAQSTNRFVYDGWNLIAVLSPNSSLLSSFTWGLDLSGSLQGAGGVGGLLFTRNTELGMQNFVAHDGNGNVTALVNATDGTVSAQYEYGPFGELLRATGPMAKANPYRFSTKYHDDESDLLYYGYRSYNPNLGRWLSRDPLGNLTFQETYLRSKSQSEKKEMLREALMPTYAFNQGDGINKVDKLGLESEPHVKWAPPPCKPPLHTAYIQVGVGYWGHAGPFVDNGSFGGNSDNSTHCPLYPVPIGNAFSDSPSWTAGKIEFVVCRVCIRYCPCRFENFPEYKIVGIGPCIRWKSTDKGELGIDVGEVLEGPNQNWQVGLDTDWPNAAKGGCFKCNLPARF